MSADTQEKKAFDSPKYAAIAIDHEGWIHGERYNNDREKLLSDIQEVYRADVENANKHGRDTGLPTWDSYIRERDVRKLVEEAYEKGLTDGRAGK